MKKIFKLLAIPALAASVLVFSSCEKALTDATETADSGQDFADDMQEITTVMDVVQDISLDASFMQKNGNANIPESVFQYIDTIYTDGDGIEIIADFGNNGTLCGDGYTRFAKLGIKANKPYSEVGSKVELTCLGTIWGQRWFMQQLRPSPSELTSQLILWMDPARNDVFTIERKSATQIDFVGDFQYSAILDTNFASKGGFQTFKGAYSLTQTEGVSTTATDDDKWELSGSCNLVNRSGKPYEVKVTEPLTRKSAQTCSKTFTQGKLELQNEGSNSVLKLDFGDGTCDNEIIITLPGGFKKTYTVK